MPPRVYAPALMPDTTSLDLPPEEAAHLARVLRVRPGEAVRVFNGRGFECEASVTSVGKDAVAVAVHGAVASAAECRVRVTLAQAVLKGDKIDDVLRDAVMLGVVAVRPIVSARADVPGAAFARGGRVERWRRIAVSSVKQCGRAVVPDVHPAGTLAECLARDSSDVRILLAEPAAGEAAALDTLLARPAVSSALVLVGPEGGWAPGEVAAATAAGAVPVTLGRRTLRADAAALVALSVLLHRWGDL
jgi:16S rRNA (uracil1498-N3)-methyltransferase